MRKSVSGIINWKCSRTCQQQTQSKNMQEEEEEEASQDFDKSELQNQDVSHISLHN